MQKLLIIPTSTTPEVSFSPEENIFFIRGISSPEDVRAMYYPVIEWVVAFVNEIIERKDKSYTPDNPLRFKSDLVYFNSSSAKFLYDIFIELKRLIPLGIPVVVEWFYEEEDIDLKEGGMDIALLAEMEFVFIPKKS
jgi:SiaC family regulatory phosphoprotein